MAASSPLVFVTVGTDHHPFDRLIGWVDAWAAERGAAVRCIVQHGRSKAPSFAEARAFLPPAELARLLGEATVVVAHGGPGTILGARDAGSVPVVVARRPDLGEHVDGHQLRFVARLAEAGEIHRADDESELRELLEAALADPASFHRSREGGGAEETAARFGALVDELSERPAPQGPRIVFVAGWGRSGSTLLDRMLGQVPGVFSAGELRDVWRRGVLEDRLCGCGERFSTCPVWTEIGRRAFGSWEGIDVLEMQRLRDRLDRPWAPPLVLASRFLPGPDRDVARYVDALERLYLAIHEATGARVIVDSSKIPTYLLLLRRIPGVDLRVVHLVRDSRGVVFSWQRHVERVDGGMETAGDEREMTRYGTGSAAARYLFYNGLTHAVQLGLPSSFLRYEDLIRAPLPAVQSVLRHAGIDAEGEALRFIGDRSVELGVNHTVDGNPMRLSTGAVRLREDDEWRSRMDPKARRLVSAVTAPLLSRYGYRRRGEG
jgi:UDP-N-acetylglucosamine transferase subunit ALG13